ncbi:MAG: TetR/AcrR family transcriptional regulator [Deltaproteobacteria bacterium]|nr:TetR/AcrR family transcriptional regulator [Deltaproteobacteria bacterium]
MSANIYHASDSRKDKETVILDAACRVFREKGFHQARITDIAQTAGISYGLVYHYFQSKADLFDAILKEWWTGLFNLMEKWDSEAESVEGQLGALVTYFLEQYQKKPDLVHIFITEISRSAANLTPARLHWFKAFLSRTEKIMAVGQSGKILRTDIKARYLTYIFLGAIESFVSAMVLENQPLRSKTQKQRIAIGLLQVFMNGARPTDS